MPSRAAIPKWNSFSISKIPYRSLPEVLEEFFLPGHDSLVVTGTHGKTTTTSLLAWIFPRRRPPA